ncbi:MAG: ferritin [Oscillospiraceae bacterium]|nr:ferritin [Oscillospiraceae bacterium]
MISEKLRKALSEQVNAEYYSAYLYLAMSAAADQMGLKGASNWLFAQAQEEMAHGTHIYQYILERGEAPNFAAIDLPQTAFVDIREIFDRTLEHEQKVTRLINAIATLAMQESDHACYQFMMWFVNEQVEEEASASEIIDKLKLIGDNEAMLLTLDNELGTRVFVDPFPAE